MAFYSHEWQEGAFFNKIVYFRENSLDKFLLHICGEKQHLSENSNNSHGKP